VWHDFLRARRALLIYECLFKLAEAWLLAPALHHWTTLQFAAAKGQLAACRLLVDRGAEGYTNPMNTYPPVLQAAWNKQAEVVKYFLEEIPDRAAGTNGLGIAINLAA
jgi:hypothetical protein